MVMGWTGFQSGTLTWIADSSVFGSVVSRVGVVRGGTAMGVMADIGGSCSGSEPTDSGRNGASRSSRGPVATHCQAVSSATLIEGNGGSFGDRTWREDPEHPSEEMVSISSDVILCCGSFIVQNSHSGIVG